MSPFTSAWPRRFRSSIGGLLLLSMGSLVLPACAQETAPTGGEPHDKQREPADSKVAPAKPAAPERTVRGLDAPASPLQDVERVASAKGSGRATDVTPGRGKALFAKHCAICHGEAGDGEGKFAYLMNPRPRNFKQGKFKLATTDNQIPSDEDLMRTISRGMPGSAMPPWGHLPLTDLEALVQFVRQLHVEASRAELEQRVRDGTHTAEELPDMLAARTQPGAPLVAGPEPGFDELRWFTGRRIYLEGCASCHGAEGQPVPEAVKFDEEGYPVPPRSFVNGIFKGGAEGYQLYARIAKGLKGTPMPAYEDAYTPEETWDLVHYVRSLARAGSQERAQLRQGTFVAPNIRSPLPTGPMDAAWQQARPLYVALTPLWWTEERIEGLVVQALHDDEELAIRLSWIDPTIDDRTVRHDEFRDAVAIQFSLTSDPPFYMGERGEHGGVNIWFWKADRHKDIAEKYQDVDDAFPSRAVDRYPEQGLIPGESGFVEWPRTLITQHDPLYMTAWGAGNLVADPKLKTAAECLVARGPGTLSGKPAEAQLVQGGAVYERGVWYVQLQRSMHLPHEHGEEDERVFRPGDYLPVSFAIWNGSAGDRDGKKNISIWQKLVIE